MQCFQTILHRIAALCERLRENSDINPIKYTSTRNLLVMLYFPAA